MKSAILVRLAGLAPTRLNRSGQRIALLVAFGVFLGWMSAPDFVRREPQSVAGSLVVERAPAVDLLSGFAAAMAPGRGAALTAGVARTTAGWPAALLDAGKMDAEDAAPDDRDEAETAASEPGARGSTRHAQASRTSYAPPPAGGPNVQPSFAASASALDPARRRLFPGLQTASAAPAALPPSGAGASSSPASPAGGGVPQGSGGGGRDPGSPGPGEHGSRKPAASSPVAPIFEDGRMLVTFGSTASGVDVAKLLASVGADVLDCYAENACVLSLPPGTDIPALAAAWSVVPFVESAEADFLRSAASDSMSTMQWSLENYGPPFGGLPDADIDVTPAWSAMQRVWTTRVAILDTGFDLQHPDLKDVIAGAWTVTGSGVTSNAEHGTEVAGVLGAVGENGHGIAGVNKSWAGLYLVKVFGDGSTASDDAIIRAIYSLPSDTRVANLSFAGAGPSRQLCRAIAARSSVLFVAAAGNNSSSAPTYPAACGGDNLISVASTDRFDLLAVTSSWGDWVDLAAPGDGIFTTASGSGYTIGFGTSLAAPHVAGVASLLFARDQGATPPAVKRAILGGGDHLVQLDWFTSSGRRLNACGALLGPSVAACAYHPGLP